MSVYNKNGQEVSTVYGVSGSSLSSAYNVNGTEVFSTSGHRDWSGMSSTFVSSLGSAVSYIQTYLTNHQNAFAFPVFTDVHTYFGWNEPNYIAYNYSSLFPVFLFLGDMINTYGSTELNNAVYYMEGADGQNMLVSMGNHEWGSYDTEGSDPYPKTWYDDLLPASCVMFSDDGLTYYYDDAVNNVRYIMLDSNSTVKKQSGVQRFDMDALNWLASVLENSGTKDIIVLNHAIGQSFYLVTDTQQTELKSDTTITNSTTFNNVLNAFKNKTTVSVTVDGVSNSHDFSSTTGNLIGYITGHYHNAGHIDTAGFNKWTCPALIRNNLTDKGMSFFIVDKTSQKVIFIVCRIQNSAYESYEYSY